MNILVIGSGGREHAIIKGLKKSKLNQNIFCSPGNAGIAQISETIPLNIKNHSEVINFCQEKKINLVIIGPEDPLVDGLSDSLRKKNIAVFGPSQEAAQLEGSKIFAKNFMQEANIPTAHAVTVSSVNETLNGAKKFSAPYVLKADGLAAGKGVYICKTFDDLKLAAENIFEKKILGDAGNLALLEQNLPGKELSFLVLTNGSSYQALPLAQDHKRLKDQNEGPNTGGMGTVAPLQINSELYQKIISKIIEPSVQHLKNKNYLFRGVLFIGVMVVDNEPYVLEYNVRFGDPETQVILPLIKNDLTEIFYQLSQGKLDKLQFNSKTAICIVNAAKGYPESPQKNIPIELPADSEYAYTLHAGTALNADKKLVSSGGRVLNIVAIDENPAHAYKLAYEQNEKIVFSGRQFRTDIGKYQ